MFYFKKNVIESIPHWLLNDHLFIKFEWYNKPNKIITHWDGFWPTLLVPNQYLVWSSFALITACILIDLLSMTFWNVSDQISFHSSTTLSYNSCTPLGGVWYLLRALFRSIQRCSMGLMARDYAGQVMTLMLLSSSHLVAFLEVCLGSLSCWNILSPSGISYFSSFPPPPNPKFHSIALCPLSPEPLWAPILHSTLFHPTL